MTARERRLLAGLAGAALAAAAAFVALSAADRVARADAAVAKYGAALEGLPPPADAALRDRLIALEAADPARGAAFRPGSLTAFAAETRELLAKEGIAPGRYRLISGQGEEAVEYVLRCDVRAFLRFLRTASSDEYLIDVASLSLRGAAADGAADVTVRLRYAQN